MLFRSEPIALISELRDIAWLGTCLETRNSRQLLHYFYIVQYLSKLLLNAKGRSKSWMNRFYTHVNHRIFGLNNLRARSELFDYFIFDIF